MGKCFSFLFLLSNRKDEGISSEEWTYSILLASLAGTDESHSFVCMYVHTCVTVYFEKVFDPIVNGLSKSSVLPFGHVGQCDFDVK